MLTSVMAASPPVGAESALQSSASFGPITPVRAMDTRLGLGAATFNRGTVRVLDLAKVAPPGATAVSLNVTAVDPAASTYLTVWPTGVARPDTSNVNVSPGQNRSNAVVVGLGSQQSVSLYNFDGRVEVIVDVMGWFTGGFRGVTPTRLMDTRRGLGGTRLSANAATPLTVAGVAGVPRNAAAVVVNITAVAPTAQGGYLTAWPAGGRRPDTSNVNFTVGSGPTPNLAIVGVGTAGRISLFNGVGAVDVIVDVMGWFQANTVAPQATPQRLLDTRRASCGVALGPGETRTLKVTDRSDVGAVVLNVTAASATEASYLTVWPSGQARPNSSNLNMTPAAGATANLVTVAVGDAGQVDFYNAFGRVELIVDSFATFAGTTPRGVATPCPDYVAGGGTALLAEYAEHRGLGVDRIGVWVCRVPLTTTNPFYASAGLSRTGLDASDMAAYANQTVSPYYQEISRGRYRAQFEPLGVLDLADDDEPLLCLRRARLATGPEYTNVMAFDDLARGWGGVAAYGRFGLPRLQQRGAVMGIGHVEDNPWFPQVIAHELGHTLGWPHSFVNPANEYDNPFDMMSGDALGQLCDHEEFLATHQCDPPRTLAVNLLASGWIDDHETVVHRGGSMTATMVGQGRSGLQLVMAPDAGNSQVFLTVEARVATRPNLIEGTGGVAVHVVDQRHERCGAVNRAGTRLPCTSIVRYQRQASGVGATYDHVVAPGQTKTFHGVTVRNVRSASGGYVVTVSGAFRAPVSW
jgi:hypothetical protein